MKELKTTVIKELKAESVHVPTESKPRKMQLPPYWAKKNLSKKMLTEIEKSLKSEPVITNMDGEYRTGTFLYSHAIVIVNVIDGLWCIEIHSEYAIGLPLIKDVRYKFLPSGMIFALIFPPKGGVMDVNFVTLYQIPGE